MDFESTLLELNGQGFECSPILMILALALDGAENPDLVRAMGGLCAGMGRTGGACGALTGGACVLGYFTAKGVPEELEHSRSREIVAKYVKWFREQNGCENCHDILGGDLSKYMSLCPAIIEASYFKITELLTEYGILE